ncbi:type II and III secretion system protein [Cyanobacterium aponinum]|uniref:Type II and III secretion system protein n=1 Tax=Cyanobacterium aponinum (strain PCC 10605) TaxID=755178 RepID=K9Z6X7_CYAAP|nr:type II and III secretion system protein [Cyanobacterium aponinum]AFZ54894.1 type II and III secretion system protein [Cyanobacterium aponinum PCC 10605]
MNKFLFNQVKVVSGTTAFILLWQSFAIANPRLNKTLKIKKSPEWIAQLSTQNQDVLVPNPIVEIDGKPVDSTQPTIPAPQFLPRAVAPPVGDMSVSNVRNAIPTVNLGTSALIPRLVLRDAPATEVLALLTRAAGLNIIFTDQSGTEGSGATVSLDLENEPIQDVFNSVLLISGLKANRQGNTVFVGNKLPPTVKNTITRSIRLNQYSAIGAASFLNSQGAQGNIVELKEEEQDGRVTQTFEVKPLESEEKDSEYLVLKGLTVHADPIHDTITLVGEPYLVQTATSFLTQLDVRRRQVAVNVKVVDIQLDQVDSFGSSFSFGIDNTGVVQDGGVGVINFGTNNQNVDSESWRTSGQGLGIPGYADNELVDPFNNEIVITEEFSTNLSDSLQDTVERSLANVLDQESASNLTDTLSRNFTDTINRSLSQFGNTTNFTRDQVETLTRNLQQELINTTGRTLSESQLSALTQDVVRDITNNVGRTVTRTLQGIPLGSPNSGQISPFGVNYDATQPGNPATVRPGRNFNVPQAFLAQIRANVTSGNAKILTDPTLVVQEGQVGAVKLVENVVTSVNTSIDQLSGVRTTTPVIEPAGLTLSVVVDKIDDNGFITLQVEPNISAPGTPQVFRSGVGADNVITPLVERTVSSGKIRLRDGQTLILSGIIQDGERTTVSKVPILGDLPIIGSLFRSTVKDKARSEVVVILTPQILDDSEGYSGFGYNYTPSRETGKYLRERGLNIPTTPY